MERIDIYSDIADRTDGDIYLGVVGPVRTGKSTFITRFMEQMVLPNIENLNRRERAQDELPQSGAGKMIMTTQPKFVPNEAIEIKLKDEATMKMRLIDCVGYMVRGAQGTQDGEAPRMVRTPWYENDIPFERAAEIGTRKVITDHSTIGIVVTTDGSIADLPRTAYVDPEERVIAELKNLGKPYIVILNTRTPVNVDTQRLGNTLSEKYDVPVMVMDVMNMGMGDINSLLEKMLFEFPIASMHIDLPEWMYALDDDNWLLKNVFDNVRHASTSISRVRDHESFQQGMVMENVKGMTLDQISLGNGNLDYTLNMNGDMFYKVIGEECGCEIKGERYLLSMMKELVSAKHEYDHVAEALRSVRETGYGLVAPRQEELTLEMPEMVRSGTRFGVRLKASAPSLHMIRVDIQTEVSPIVGTEKQSEDLVKYLLSEFESDPARIWNTNMFGKSLDDLVREGLSNKLMRMPDEARMKIQETLSKIINNGSGGMICILL